MLTYLFSLFYVTGDFTGSRTEAEPKKEASNLVLCTNFNKSHIILAALSKGFCRYVNS